MKQWLEAMKKIVQVKLRRRGETEFFTIRGMKQAKQFPEETSEAS